MVYGLRLPRPGTEDDERLVYDVETLDSALDAIATNASKPLIAELVDERGARLGIGLATRNSILSYNASPDPPYFLSAGGIGSADDDVVFYLHGHWTEFPGSALILEHDAREAARRFLAIGARPDNVTWEEV